MKQTLYISIDDTDEISYPISTGMLAENISEYIDKNFAPCTFVSRHQLFIDERINYTSHNSSMCFTTEISKNELRQIINYAEKILLDNSAPSAECGIAVAFKDEIINIKDVINFGQKAKNTYLLKDDAFMVAKANNIYLKALKNDGHGVIGALAGIGLRLDGNDGRIKGKIQPKKLSMSVKEILKDKICDEILDENLNKLDLRSKITFNDKIKLIVKNHKSTLMVKHIKNDVFEAFNIDRLRQF